jgi:hypothetical protein
MSMATPRHLGRDRWAALCLAAFAMTAFGLTFTFDSMPASLMEGLGAAEFPRLVCLIILALSVFLFFTSPPSEEEVLPEVHSCTWWTLAACLGFFPLLGLVGMLPALFLFPVIVGRLWGERRIMVLLASSTLVTVTIWLLFVRVFRFTLPGGLLGDLLFG